MKTITTILFLITSLNLFCQAKIIEGEYYLELGNEKHQIEYHLNLKPDGTFLFHSYSNIQKGIPPEVHKYGKGKWTYEKTNSFGIEKFVVSFIADKELDFDHKYTIDLNNSKARFISKSSRDRTDIMVKPKLKFSKSDISWIKGIEIPQV